MTEQEIANYLLPENMDSFWFWSERCETVSWWNGETIAFHQEIDAVLSHLAPNGLPSFHEILLVLAACRSNWLKPGQGKSLLTRYIQSLDYNPFDGTDQANREWIRPLLSGLDLVHKHFQEKPVLQRKLTLLDVILNGPLYFIPANKGAKEIARAFHEGDLRRLAEERPLPGRFEDEETFAQVSPADGDISLLTLLAPGGRIEKGEAIANVECPDVIHVVKASVAGVVQNFETGRIGQGAPLAKILIARDPSMDLIRAIHNLLDAFPELEKIESLSIREDTGLTTLPEPTDDLEEPVPDSVAARQLVRDLADNDETELSGIARLANDLIGLLHIPRDVSDPDEMPIGGFSDIANKGNLDRLLLTELALDDETLAVRVALNEALYLRRESPPRDPPRERRIFIDTGIRMWGVPRAYAHSVALALAAGAEEQDRVRFFSPDVDFSVESAARLLPARLSEREGLVDSLTRLTPHPHPGDSLRDFFDKGSDSENADRILITHPDALADLNFLPSLRDVVSLDAPLLIVTVRRDGELVIHFRSPSGDRELRRLKLDPDILLTTGRKASSSVREIPDESLPRFLKLVHPPLRTVHPLHQTMTWVASRGEIRVITLTRAGLLLIYENPQFGAIQLNDSLDTRGHYELGIVDDEDNSLILVFGKKADPRVYRIDLSNGESTSSRVLLNGLPRGCLYTKRHVVFFLQTEAVAFSLDAGKIVHRRLISAGTCEISDRFVRLNGTWYAISVGAQIDFVAITIPNETVVFPVDVAGYDVPLVLTESGVVRQFDGETNPALPFTERNLPVDSFIGVSLDRKKIAYRTTTNDARFISIDFDASDLTPKTYVPALVPLEYARIQYSMPTIRKRFDKIEVTESSVVLSRGRNRSEIRFEGEKMFILRDTYQDSFIQASFRQTESIARGYSLDVAEFPDGSRAFLDSRGMIHLQSSDDTIAEITFILPDSGELAGWMSNGEFFGRKYFSIDGNAGSSLSAFRELRRWTAHIHSTNPATNTTA